MSGKAATQTKEKPSKKKRKTWGEVRVFGRWCKGCGLCIAFCPTQVFEADDHGYPEIRYPERCTGCKWCEQHCPDLAIQVTRHTGQEGADAESEATSDAPQGC
jgi:2-oxoglutarate ferredoxin oxidoreductase subunit delta